MSEEKFFAIEPKLEDYWRAIILFGRNVATYKFALAKSLLELAPQNKTIIRLEDLAEPYSRHIVEHIKEVKTQTTSRSSRFLDTCKQFGAQEISKTKLIDTTVSLGFGNVIDAFHNLSAGATPVRFFTDERLGATKGIILTDELFELLQVVQAPNLPSEVEARWRLVENAWDLGISSNLISYDSAQEQLFALDKNRRRVDVTSSRGALNGYQKGKCFYSFAEISVISGSQNLADIDHFFPYRLIDLVPNINGVWNLVLASQECNRGEKGKLGELADLKYLERLHKRNEFLITSQHPLRQTLMLQTGNTEKQRRQFLQTTYNTAQAILGTGHQDGWIADFEHPPTF